jgi:nucleotide-binding universal stress UspA family protein
VTGDAGDAGGARDSDGVDGTVPPGTAETVARLERYAATIRTQVGVPCEVAVVSGAPVRATLQAARNADCDLVVTPYDTDDGHHSQYLRGIFAGPLDAVAFRSRSERRRWTRVLVLVARPGDAAHGMIDFATRLAGSGTVSVTTCIDAESERRRAETRLERLVETAGGAIETRVARSSVEAFVDANAGTYDLIVVGSSGERSPASRFVSPPTFGRLEEFDCDIAVFNRGTT